MVFLSLKVRTDKEDKPITEIYSVNSMLFVEFKTILMTNFADFPVCRFVDFKSKLYTKVSTTCFDVY